MVIVLAVLPRHTPGRESSPGCLGCCSCSLEASPFALPSFLPVFFRGLEEVGMVGSAVD